MKHPSLAPRRFLPLMVLLLLTGLLDAATAPTCTTAPLLSNVTTGKDRNASDFAVIQGNTITVSTGTWTSTDPLVFSYQWRRATTDAGANLQILTGTGATTATYTTSQADAGFFLTCVVTAAVDGDSSANASSNPSPRFTTAVTDPNLPPTNTVLPVISGFLTPGQILSVSSGTWTDPDGTTPTIKSYQWHSASSTSSAPSVSNKIDGTTSGSYTLLPGDLNKYIACTVTATDGTNDVAAYSAWTAIVISSPPVNSNLPVISGTPTQGQTLTVSDGTWTDPDGTTPTIKSYQWHRTNSATTALDTTTAITEATSNTYTLVQADVSKYITCVVTATDSTAGTTNDVPATAARKGPIANVNDAPVAVAVTFTSSNSTANLYQQGDTLTIATPNWSDPDGDSLSYEFNWYRSTTKSGIGTPLKSFSNSNISYKLTQADVGYYIQCAIKASDGSLTTTAYSAFTTNQVADANVPPVNTTLPAVSGTPTQGQTLAVSDGAWTDDDSTIPMIKSYQWHRADSFNTTLSDTTKITGQTTSSYTLTQSDVGMYVTCVVTATDGTNNTEATALRKGLVNNINDSPLYDSGLTLTGSYSQGTDLTCSSGNWTDADKDTLIYTYRWYRATDASGTNASLIATNIPTSEITSDAYTLQIADIGKYIACTVTVTDSIVTTPPSQTTLWIGPITAANPPTFTLSTSTLSTDNSKIQHGFAAWATNLATNSGGDGDISFTCSLASGGSSLFSVAPFINKSGDLFFTPNLINGSTIVTVTMSAGGIESAPQTFTMNIIGTQSPASDPGFDVYSVTIQVKVTGGTAVSASVNGQAGSNSTSDTRYWDFPWIDVPIGGELKLNVTAEDANGGAGSASATVTSTIPTTTSSN